MYLITYEIKPPRLQRLMSANREPQRSIYSEIEETITGFGNWFHYFGDTWIVNTDLTVDEMADALRQFVSDKDSLLITAIQPPYQGWLPEEAWKWLNETARKQKISAGQVIENSP
jgi:hypothetical protein